MEEIFQCNMKYQENYTKPRFGMKHYAVVDSQQYEGVYKRPMFAAYPKVPPAPKKDHHFDKYVEQTAW